jgi:hypothetical protein
VNRGPLAAERMIEGAITVGVLFGLACIVCGAVLMLRVVRAHGSGRPGWHLLVSSPAHLDLTAYSPRAVRLARAARFWWLAGMVSLFLAAVVKVLGESGVLYRERLWPAANSAVAPDANRCVAACQVVPSARRGSRR